MIVKRELRKVIEEVLEECEVDSVESVADELMDRFSVDFIDELFDDEEETEENE